jgi:hypothetical protein
MTRWGLGSADMARQSVASGVRRRATMSARTARSCIAVPRRRRHGVLIASVGRYDHYDAEGGMFDPFTGHTLQVG